MNYNYRLHDLHKAGENLVSFQVFVFLSSIIWFLARHVVFAWGGGGIWWASCGYAPAVPRGTGPLIRKSGGEAQEAEKFSL